MKTTVIYHSADYDGIFCREIARKFLPDAVLIGWDFADAPLAIPPEGQIYILDLPADRVFEKGSTFAVDGGELCFLTTEPPPKRLPLNRIVWIDHHASSIASHPEEIPGYRIDGVAACRLAWQWFATLDKNTGEPGAVLSRTAMEAILPDKAQFVERAITEPMAVRLAGEYDIWDKRDPDAELFQHGLRSEVVDFQTLLQWPDEHAGRYTVKLLNQGRGIQYAKTQENESVITANGFNLEWEGLKFLACNHARFNSHLFTAALKPDHDACLGFRFDGKNKKWTVSLYHAPGKERHDLSLIAVKHGGGGHRGACGFTTDRLPFL